MLTNITKHYKSTYSMPKLIGIFIAIVFSSFAYNQIDNVDRNKTSFQKYTDSIPTIKLPLFMSCNNNLNPIKTSISDSLIKHFGIGESYLFGKLAGTKSFIAIIYIAIADKNVPVLKTSDINGNTISKLTLLKNCGGNEICYNSTSWAKISDNYKITIVDTIKTCKLNKKDQIIPGSGKIKIKFKNYKIDEKGKIINLNK